MSAADRGRHAEGKHTTAAQQRTGAAGRKPDTGNYQGKHEKGSRK